MPTELKKKPGSITTGIQGLKPLVTLSLAPYTIPIPVVEVKGPGDTLQANQKRWLRLFRQLDLDASINHVRWQM
ncbi:VRR-NUC domain-containing protein [Photobacterium galatheae]|uniref:VRR-NUC domain-containing protein n=1 Tax=Photobacterium galatheae TaxID=1654360 RepID=UPI00202CEF9E|nr:VRR-NUC domain-containing protein [Photobacterium galatheae]